MTAYTLRSKRVKRMKRAVNKWISATRTKNYLMKDPIIDWLKIKRMNTNSDYTTSFLCKQGIKFEDLVVERFYNKFPNNVVNVNANHTNYTSDEKYDETLNLMKKGTPIILQGVVKNFENGTAGVPDVIIRSDWINKLVSRKVLTKYEEKISTPLNIGFHYRIIDIKFTTIPLRSDGMHILNSGRFPSYKGQTFIYSDALSRMQSYQPPKAYILGRGWRYTSKGMTYEGRSPFQRLGEIDFVNADSYIRSEVDKSLKWIERVEREGKDWDISDRMTIPELYPNMSNGNDGGWRREKLIIANDIKEITKLYYVGKRERDICLKKGINSWDKCSSTILDMRGRNGRVLDKMIELNRGDHGDAWMLPSTFPKIPNDKFNIYIDFEVINDAFMEVGFQKRPPIIFFIGLGYEKDGEWVFERRMICDDTYEEEERICKEVEGLIKSLTHGKDYRLVHWSGAEPRQWEDVAEKYDLDDFKDGWYDLLDYFKKNEIVVKGSFGYRLKEICWALREQKKISSDWEDDCKSGMSAMIMLEEIFEETTNPDEVMKHEKTRYISKYNEIDCKVLMEIIKLFY